MRRCAQGAAFTVQCCDIQGNTLHARTRRSIHRRRRTHAPRTRSIHSSSFTAPDHSATRARLPPSASFPAVAPATHTPNPSGRSHPCGTKTAAFGLRTTSRSRCHCRTRAQSGRCTHRASAAPAAPARAPLAPPTSLPPSDARPLLLLVRFFAAAAASSSCFCAPAAARA